MKKRRAKPRDKKNPRDEGYLADIAKIFEPLINLKPPGMDMYGWMEYLLHVGTRTIDEYVCLHEFRMPGLLKVLPLKCIQGIGYRTVREGSSVWVRHDSTDPERIDIEVHNGIGQAQQVFQLEGSQFRSIRRNLTKKITCNHAPRNPRSARH